MKGMLYLSTKSKPSGRALDFPKAFTFLNTKSGIGYGVNARCLIFWMVTRH